MDCHKQCHDCQVSPQNVNTFLGGFQFTLDEYALIRRNMIVFLFERLKQAENVVARSKTSINRKESVQIQNNNKGIFT